MKCRSLNVNFEHVTSEFQRRLLDNSDPDHVVPRQPNLTSIEFNFAREN